MRLSRKSITPKHRKGTWPKRGPKEGMGKCHVLVGGFSSTHLKNMRSRQSIMKPSQGSG